MDTVVESGGGSGEINGGDGVLKPGQVIRPEMTETVARELVRRCYGLEKTNIRELCSYVDRNYHVTVDESRCDDELLRWPHGFVLKVLNWLDTSNSHVGRWRSRTRI